MDAKTATVMSDLVRELCSELDLHYDDNDFFVLGQTIDKLKAAVELLKADGIEVPSIYFHVLRKYNMNFN